jgi:serine/threonine-protein kinase
MNALVTRLMAKDPEDRYASADDLADDLWRISRGREPTVAPVAAATTRLQHAPIAASSPTRRVPASRPSPVRRRRRRIPWFLILVAALLFFLGTLGLLRSVMGPDFANGWFDFLGENNPHAGPPVPQKVKVPEVVGLPIAEARRRLTGAGLKVGQISSFSNNNVAAGRVIASGVEAGTPVDRGTAINLDVSTGPPPVSSPSPTATAQSSPTATATASPTAAAQPAPQQTRQPARQPRGARNVPAAGQKNGAASASPNATAEPGAAEGKGANQGVGRPEGNSGPGGNSSSGNSGPGSGKGKN